MALGSFFPGIHFLMNRMTERMIGYVRILFDRYDGSIEGGLMVLTRECETIGHSNLLSNGYRMLGIPCT